ncbi:hypothetical protein VTN02DRAFT_3638 [Thermoascus thermophilus]
MDDASSSPNPEYTNTGPAPLSSAGTSKTTRPCDTCRKRKTRCVTEPGKEKCILCIFHNRECTYLYRPQPRKRKRDGQSDQGTDVEAAAEMGSGRTITEMPRQRKRSSASNQSSDENAAHAQGQPSLLNKTLGLHRTIYAEYIGVTSVHEPHLLGLLPYSPEEEDNKSQTRFRRVDDYTSFTTRPDSLTSSHAEEEQDVDHIERIVHPHGKALVNLYFRIIHPSYPILHKKVFLEKYDRSYREFSPPLLAAVYLLAMNWWEYDRELSSKTKPDEEGLEKLSTKTMGDVIHRPKLSTVQAGLLLLQRRGGDSWVLTSQLVAVGEELGLHLDCSMWRIPEWEKGLRRRLAWALYMQDKWGALIHGRPSHISADNWKVRHVTEDDFPESAADEDDEEGSTEVEKGRILFQYLIRLTEITADVLDTFYTLDRKRINQVFVSAGMHGLLELIKPLAIRLKSWMANLPTCLNMEETKTRKLCSNGYLHLAYYTTEIIIHRFIIRSLPPSAISEIRDVCREAAKARLLYALQFIEALRPEHLQSFWWFASAKSLALIGTYGGLLWVTSPTDAEAELYYRKLEEYRWTLKVRAKGVHFVQVGLEELEESLQCLDKGKHNRRSAFEDVGITITDDGRNSDAENLDNHVCPSFPRSADVSMPNVLSPDVGFPMPTSSQYFSLYSPEISGV